MSRIVLRAVLQAVLGTVLTIGLAWLYFLAFLQESPAEAFGDAIGLVLIFIDIGIVTWLVLLVVGGLRGRGIGWGVGGSVLAAVIGTIVNLIWIVILSVINGGADIFAVALGVQAGVFFLIAAIATAFIVLRGGPREG